MEAGITLFFLFFDFLVPFTVWELCKFVYCVFIKINIVHYLSRCHELLGCCICRIPK